jgi:hypothetical protein
MKKRGAGASVPATPIFKIINGGSMDYLKMARDGFDASKKKFDSLAEEAKTLVEKQKTISQRLNEIGAEQLRLDGEAEGYQKILDAKEEGPAEGAAPITAPTT